MRAEFLVAILFTVLPLPAEFRHLYTFGSPHGIHPPRLLNRKPAATALGRPENPYGLVYPVAVTTDLQGRVWITDTGTASVHVFDHTNGAYREIRKLDGIPLERPSGIAADAEGRIFLADAANGAVYAFDEKGDYAYAVVKRGAGLLESPSALALSDDRRTIYVADPPRNVIVALNREGEINGTISLPPELQGVSSLAIVQNQVYALGTQRFRAAAFSPAGKLRGEIQWEGIAFPSAFAFDPARRQFLVANPRWMVVQVFNEEGRNLEAFGHLGDGVDQMRGVDCLYIGRDELVYIVDSKYGKVLVFGENLAR
jgi:sugar lactone lactonase YvrE